MAGPSGAHLNTDDPATDPVTSRPGYTRERRGCAGASCYRRGSKPSTVNPCSSPFVSYRGSTKR